MGNKALNALQLTDDLEYGGFKVSVPAQSSSVNPFVNF